MVVSLPSVFAAESLVGSGTQAAAPEDAAGDVPVDADAPAADGDAVAAGAVAAPGLLQAPATRTRTAMSAEARASERLPVNAVLHRACGAGSWFRSSAIARERER